MKKLKFLLCFILVVILGIFVVKKPIQKFLYPVKYEEQVFKYAEEFDVPPELVFAVIKTESSFRPEAVSHMDAYGLMQITYDTWEWANGKIGKDETFDDIFDPEVNIRYGAFILSYLTEDFGYEEVALAAYNAGRGNVQKWLRNEEYSHDEETLFYIPFKETREYVVKVEKSKDAYIKLYPDKFLR